MSATKYTYTISTATANGIVDATALAEQIQASAIVTALDYINTSGDTLDIWFKDGLSEGDEATLTALVTAHDGTPVTPPPSQMELTNIATNPDDKALQTAQGKLEGSSTLLVSHDWCDRTTWWTDSVQVENETLSTSDNLTFNSAHINWIDLSHGKVPYEDEYDPSVAIMVDDEVVLTGFTINYAAGTVTFESSQAGSVVKASYNYENGSTWKITPDSGKILKILGTIIKFAENVQLGANQKFIFQLYMGDTPLMPATVYKNMLDFAKCADGKMDHLPTLSGMSHDMIRMEFDYLTSKNIRSSYGLNIRIWISDHEPITGEWACVVAKALSLDE